MRKSKKIKNQKKSKKSSKSRNSSVDSKKSSTSFTSQSSVVDPPPADGWGCTTCSYINIKEVESCEVCLASKPIPHWLCPFCDHKNKLTVANCTVCSQGIRTTGNIFNTSRSSYSSGKDGAVDNLYNLVGALNSDIKNLQTINGPPRVKTASEAKKTDAPPLLVKPKLWYGEVMCDACHYLTRKHEKDVPCFECGRYGNVNFQCTPCEYYICSICVQKEIKEITQGRLTELDEPPVSSSSESDFEIEGDHDQVDPSEISLTYSTTDESNNKKKEKITKDMKKKQKRIRERRTKKLTQQRNKSKNSMSKSDIEDYEASKRLRKEYDTIMEKNPRLAQLMDSGRTSYKNAFNKGNEKTKEAQFCYRDLLVTDCAVELANGEYVQYSDVFRNVYNKLAIIVFIPRQKAYLHLKCFTENQGIDDIRRVLTDIPSHADIMYRNFVDTENQPLALPSEGWETVIEEYGQPGKYQVTNPKLVQQLKAKERGRILEEYNSVEKSLESMPAEVIHSILLFTDPETACNWGRTCKLLASDLVDPHSGLWREFAERHVQKDNDGACVMRRRSSLLFWKKKEIEQKEYEYLTPKHFVLDGNRKNTWWNIRNWKKIYWTPRENPLDKSPPKVGLIANMSLDVKRGFLVLHIIHNLQADDGKIKISPTGACICKFYKDPKKRAQIPEKYVDEVLWPTMEKIVYDRMRERHILAYFPLETGQEGRARKGVANRIGNMLANQKPFRWERGFEYCFLHHEGARRSLRPMKDFYNTIPLFSSTSLSEVRSSSKYVTIAESYFRYRGSYSSKIDSFTMGPTFMEKENLWKNKIENIQNNQNDNDDGNRRHAAYANQLLLTETF